MLRQHLIPQASNAIPLLKPSLPYSVLFFFLQLNQVIKLAKMNLKFSICKVSESGNSLDDLYVRWENWCFFSLKSFPAHPHRSLNRLNLLGKLQFNMVNWSYFKFPLFVFTTSVSWFLLFDTSLMMCKNHTKCIRKR